jgi:hypothetical protein
MQFRKLATAHAAELPNLILSFKRQVFLDVLWRCRTAVPTGPVPEETEPQHDHRCQPRS